MLKHTLQLTLALLMGLIAHTAQAGEFLANTNLNGSDYNRIADAGIDARQCEQRCERDGRCKAWTLVKDGSQGGVNVCYLKDPVPARSASNCCDSGIKYQRPSGPVSPIDPRQPRTPSNWQSGFDRPGNDLRRITDFAAAPQACADLCLQQNYRDNTCKAWVYVRPSLQDQGAVCYLKHTLTPPVANDCCSTGIGTEVPR